MHGFNEYGYGLWPVVIFNIAVFSLFAYFAFRPRTKRDWRTLGAFSGFMVALFSEMFGYPLTIYILTSILGKRYPVLDPFSHANGHLWVVLAGDSPVLFNIVHIISNIFIFGGLFIIAIGWRGIHLGNGQLVMDGIYRFVRHPQYSGFILAIIGFLLQWPTLITLIMAPMLFVMYTRLARKEEKTMINTFGEQYSDYIKKVPGFIPKKIITFRDAVEILRVFKKPIQKEKSK
ncbi:methyltransferase family protein [Clostridium sp. MT-14]|uniref:methyltransferase family protein n=1 Tax=Clostridium sp. MT-14 TaxID=3348360 RepID=UPI0035F43F6F